MQGKEGGKGRRIVEGRGTLNFDVAAGEAES